MQDTKILSDDEYQENIYFVSPPNEEDNEWNEYLLMAGALFLCILLSIFVFFYYVYFRMDSHSQPRRRRRPRISRTRRFSLRGGAGVQLFFSPANDGLRREVVDSLPVFVYRLENFSEGLSCAVCLSEFEENEKAKLLPNCNHSFHVECVNMWFYSHSTCPLCRANVEKEPEQAMEISVMEEEAAKAVERSRSGEEHVESINGEINCVSIDVPQNEKEEK